MFTLTEIQAPVTTLVFINSGVYLTIEGSPVLEHLQNLEQQGVKYCRAEPVLTTIISKRSWPLAG